MENNQKFKEIPIIGMSPGNSYFKDAEVEYLLKSVLAKYERVAVLIADIPAVSTYMAFGYSESKARSKAVLKGNNLKNRTAKIAASLGIAEKVQIIDWATEVANNKTYLEKYNEVEKLYLNNPDFQKETDQTTKSVLENSDKKINDLDSATKQAVLYLLSELAFLEFAPQYLNAEKVIYVYHKNWPVYENYISGKFNRLAKPGLEFLLLENPYETFSPMEQSPADAVFDTGILRASYQDYAPAFMTDIASGQHSGIFFDLITEIARMHDMQIKFTEQTGYGVIQEGLEKDRFDIFCSTVWPTPERKLLADFSTSVYASKVFMWVREGEENKNLKDPLFRIAIKDGDISHSIAQSEYPNNRQIRVPQLSNPLELFSFVTQGKADATFGEEYIVKQFNLSSPVKLIKTGSAIREYENTFMIKKGDMELKALLDKAIANLIESGVVSSLIEKYTGSKETFEP